MFLLVKKIIIFSIPILILVGVLECGLSRLPNIYNIKNISFKKGLADWEILVLGSSHEFDGVNTQLFGRTSYNLAIPNQSIYYGAQMILKHMDDMPKLKLVIMPISYFSLESNLIDVNTVYYSRFWEIPPPPVGRSSVSDFQRFSFIALYNRRIFSFIRDGFKVKIGLNSQDGILEDNGWFNVPFESGSKDRINNATGLVRVRDHLAGMDTQNLYFNQYVLKSFLDELAAKKISVVLITSPVYSTYYLQIQQDKYDSMQKIIKDLSSSYHIKYHNYLMDTRFIKEDFFNNDHLNVSGAEKFSKIIKTEIIDDFFPPHDTSHN